MVGLQVQLVKSNMQPILNGWLKESLQGISLFSPSSSRLQKLTNTL